jgi:Protein of unknown function, DUF547
MTRTVAACLSATIGRVALTITVLALAACSTIVKPSAASADAPLPTLSQAEQGYARVLQRHVNTQGEVDFAALRGDTSDAGLPALESYLRAIAATPLDAVPQDATLAANTRLAHMINAYNALSMYNVIASGIPRTHAGTAKLTFFVLRKFDIGGKTMSLYAFENDVIRKLGEPRIHFALNCSAVSCPVLPRIPFSASTLDQELDREARAFFARPENLRIDTAQRTVYFNEILKFYTEDFTPSHAPSLISYAQKYSSQTIPTDYATAFTPYDWTVANSQRGK